MGSIGKYPDNVGDIADEGKAPITLAQGQTWYEGPDDVHLVSRNASDSARAKYLVFMVKDKGAPILTPVK